MPDKKHNSIDLEGVKVHNLKNINVSIKKNALTVITGLSGSGKSSLAFDTIYAEGQRRYIESLSSYARQFLGRMNKPEVDFISGIPPAIAIEQKVNTRNPRSTVGTSSEIYDYLKLLFARIGKTYTPDGNLVKKDSVTDIVNFLLTLDNGSKALILAPFDSFLKIKHSQLANDLKHLGINRVEIDGQIYKIKDINEDIINNAKHFNNVIDRIIISDDEDEVNRFADSVQEAYKLGDGKCIIKLPDQAGKEHHFSNKFEFNNIEFEEPSVHMFSFNNPVGACPVCEGYGKVIGIDKDLIVPDKNLSIYQDAIVCWKGEKMKEWKNDFIYSAEKFNFPIHKPFYELTDEQERLLWTGNAYFKGLNRFFGFLEENKYKIQYRVMMARYRGKTTCWECNGKRLKKEAGYVKINQYAIQDLVDISIEKLKNIFDDLKLSEHELSITKRLLVEIENRIEYLCDVGLGYLTLNRLSSTLSGGESQRINIATTLGSSLVGSMYILDEPSIGLHPRDTHRLIKVLNKIKSIGNTLIVVEHEEEIIRASDDVVDIGPKAGQHGGEIVYAGTYDGLLSESKGLTAKYLRGEEKIIVPSKRKTWKNKIKIIGAKENNLKNIDVTIPLNALTVITGVSGSGKTTLVKSIIFPALSKIIHNQGNKTGKFSKVEGDLACLSSVEFIDQNPIGKSSRSNPVTYMKAYDEIRKLFASQPYALANNYKPSHFSFNVDGGRCDKCQGEGIIKIEMQFMADVVIPCEHCNGKRFKEDIIEVRYKNKSIHDVLEMTISESIAFFGKETKNKKIINKLQPLEDVGMGYVKLGQSSSTLSGGESQRVKLASFLSIDKNEPSLFIFDEPTTGLHFHDIKKLLDSFNALIQKGHSIVIIEHNMEVIKCADWIIDLGPEGGDEGGYLVYEGDPSKISQQEKSYTGNYLKDKLN